MDAKIDIAELAQLLAERKNRRPRIALILGSRAGALFRSSSFEKDVEAHSEQQFASLSKEDRFGRYYTVLEDQMDLIGQQNMKIIFDNALKEASFSGADMCLAELVKQGIFKVIISNNADDLLYEAFITLELKDKKHFVSFSLNPLSGQDAVTTITSHSSLDACKLIWICRDPYSFIYSLGKSRVQQRNMQYVKDVLEKMRVKEVLIVGLDLVWDASIIAALPSLVKTIWFVNEDELLKEHFFTLYKDVRELRYITGERGSYESFLLSLHWQLNPNVPRYYGLTQVLKTEMHKIQSEIAKVRSDMEELQQGVKEIQNRMDNLAYILEDVIEESIKKALKKFKND